MGGGLELALGCHYRVAAPGAQVALPEVKLGLIPGAGGTQRLPRVLGVETALNMIVSGEPVKSEVLAKLPGQKLFDKVVDGDVVDGPRSRIAAEKADVPAAAAACATSRSRTRTPTPTSSSRATRSAAMAKNFPAPLKCVDAVAASVKMKFDDGLTLERELFLALMLTPESQGAAPRLLRPSAPPTQDPRRARRHAAARRSRRWRSSAPAPWAAASR